MVSVCLPSDALLQHLPSYLGFSYLGRGVAPPDRHPSPQTWGSSSWPLPLAFNITVIQVYAPTTNAEEAEVEQFYEDLQDLLELTPKKDVLFIIGD